MEKEQEIQFMLEKIRAAEAIQRIEQIGIDMAKERLNQLGYTTKAAFEENKPFKWIDKAEWDHFKNFRQ